MSDAPARGTIARDSGLVLVAQVTGNAGYFAAVVLLARALAPSGRGTVAFITVTALIVAHVSTLGAAQAVQVFTAQRPEERGRLLTNLLLLCGACGAGAGAIVGGVLLVTGAGPEGISAPELVLLALGTVACAIEVSAAAFLQGCSRFRAYTAVTAAGPWLYAALLAGLWATAGLTVERAALVWVVAQGVPAVALCALAAQGTGFGRPSLALLRETVPFGIRAWVGGLAHFMNARVDQVILGVLATEQALGIYAVAVNASEVLFYVPSAVAAAMLPAVAAGAADLRVARTLRVFRCVTIVGVAGALVAAAVGPFAVPLVFGDAYRPSVDPFLWLLPSAVGFAASAVFSTALLASSAPSLSSLGPGVALVVGVALDLVLIPPYAATGAAAAASAALLAGGAAAAIAFGLRERHSPAELVPRRGDLQALASAARRMLGAPFGTRAAAAAQARSRRAARRTGASPS